MSATKISVTITGKEALEDLIKFFPNDYGKYIDTGKEAIHSMMRIYKLPALEAVEKGCRMVGGFKDPTIILASLYLMLKQEKLSNEIKKVEDEIKQITSQSFALETSQNFNTKESGELRQFYTGKQNELQSRHNELINEFTVVQPITVRPGQF